MLFFFFLQYWLNFIFHPCKVSNKVLLSCHTGSSIIMFFVLLSVLSVPSLQAGGPHTSGRRTDSQHKPQHQHQVRARLTKPRPQHSQLHRRGRRRRQPGSNPGPRSGDGRLPGYPAPGSGRSRPLASRQPQQQRQLV